MPVTRALRRLLRIRDIEEEQCRHAMEVALTERHRLESALAATAERDRSGRLLITASARSAELPDRLAGLEETRMAKRMAIALRPRLTQIEEIIAVRRQEYLDKRVERRQAETLIRTTEAQDALESRRHAQQSLDDWYGNRLHRNAGEEKSSPHHEEQSDAAALLATNRSPGVKET